jgi:hypothetical protein
MKFVGSITVLNPTAENARSAHCLVPKVIIFNFFHSPPREGEIP